MKKILIIIVFFIFASCNNTVERSSVIESKVDTGAAEAYFNLVDSLQTNNEITDAQWASFLNVKGNKLYIEENNISTEFTNELRNIIVEVYTTNGNDTIKKTEDMFYKLRNMYRENDSNFRNHLRWIKDNQQSILDSMIS